MAVDVLRIVEAEEQQQQEHKTTVVITTAAHQSTPLRQQSSGQLLSQPAVPVPAARHLRSSPACSSSSPPMAPWYARPARNMMGSSSTASYCSGTLGPASHVLSVRRLDDIFCNPGFVYRLYLHLCGRYPIALSCSPPFPIPHRERLNVSRTCTFCNHCLCLIHHYLGGSKRRGQQCPGQKSDEEDCLVLLDCYRSL